jgi:hypothetical protein
MALLFSKSGSHKNVACPCFGALAIGVVAACVGCQSALPGGAFALTEDARIAQRAKADSFPSPADVGLAEPTSVP